MQRAQSLVTRAWMSTRGAALAVDVIREGHGAADGAQGRGGRLASAGAADEQPPNTARDANARAQHRVVAGL